MGKANMVKNARQMLTLDLGRRFEGSPSCDIDQGTHDRRGLALGHSEADDLQRG